jgi:hypothetical protein
MKDKALDRKVIDVIDGYINTANKTKEETEKQGLGSPQDFCSEIVRSLLVKIKEDIVKVMEEDR